MARSFNPSEEELRFASFVDTLEDSDVLDPSGESTLGDIGTFLKGTAKAGARGVAQGIVGLGRAAGPLAPGDAEEKERMENFSGDLSQFFPSPQVQNKKLRGVQEFVEGGTEAAGEILPLLLGNEAGALEAGTRALVSGFGRQTAKSAGFGPIGQTVAEIPGLGAPNVFSKKLKPRASQKELVEFAKKQNLTEEQIAPLLRAEDKVGGVASKIARKGGRAEEAIELSRKGRNTAFQNLKARPDAGIKITGPVQDELFKNIRGHIKELPVELGNLMKDDLNKFLLSEQTNADLAILADAVNAQFTKRGGNRLQPINGFIRDTLRATSPQFAEEFILTNKLGKAYQQVKKRLSPTTAGQIAEGIRIATAPVQLGWAISSGNWPLMAELVGEVAAKEIAREMLINPKMQNLSGKMMSAIKNGSPELAKSAFSAISFELRKSGLDQNAVDKIQDVDINEFMEQMKLITSDDEGKQKANK